MLIAKVREYLSTGIAVVACMALAFAVITHLRNKTLEQNLDTALATNSQLSQVNEDNSSTISDLISQRQYDDEIINKIFKQYDTLKENSQIVYNQLEELKDNDTELKDMLSMRHPVSVTGLLNARTNSNKNGNGKAEATK